MDWWCYLCVCLCLVSEKRVGNVYSKAKSFVDYVRRALRRLELDESKVSVKISQSSYRTSSRNKLWEVVQWKHAAPLKCSWFWHHWRGKCFLVGVSLRISIHVRLVSYAGAWDGLGCCQAPHCWGVEPWVSLEIKLMYFRSALCHSQPQMTQTSKFSFHPATLSPCIHIHTPHIVTHMRDTLFSLLSFPMATSRFTVTHTGREWTRCTPLTWWAHLPRVEQILILHFQWQRPGWILLSTV